MARQVGDVATVDQHLPRAGRHHSDQRLHERRLAHAVAADDRDDLARRDREVDAVENLALAIGDVEIAHIKHRVPP
jgi:hypothetical protein